MNMGIRLMIQRESVGSIFTTVSMLVSASSSGAKRVLESQVEPLTMTSAAAYQPCKATAGRTFAPLCSSRGVQATS